MLLVGITGGPGSGKSTVSALFRELGAHVIASDDVARQLMKPGNEVFRAIVQAFGTAVLAKDGTLNRSALGKLAFAEGRLHELEEIIHPAVLAHERSWAQGIA